MKKMKREEMIQEYVDFLQEEIAEEKKKVASGHSHEYESAQSMIEHEKNLGESPKKTWNSIVAKTLLKNEKGKREWGCLSKEHLKMRTKIVELEGERKLSKHYKKLEPSIEKVWRQRS